MNVTDFPKNERRILYNSDSGNAFMEFWDWGPHLGKIDAEEIKSIIENSIDEMSEAGVDTLAMVLWGRFMALWPPKRLADDCEDMSAHLRFSWLPLYEAGYDAVKIMIDRCHQRGMEFLACFRMNDRHGYRGNVGRFIFEHPEWQLKGKGGGPAMNYAHEPVRQQILAYIEDLLSSYEVDGIEFDYLRWCHMFEPGEGTKHADVLTDFTRRACELLEAATQRRRCNQLILGVRVPQTLEECDYLGFDVATWIKEGLVDYVVPTDFFYTDFNAKTEDFVKLAEGTDCKIYPAVHPIICWGDEPGIMNLANYRAAAQNFYAYGADGLETYNYQYHWGRRVFPHRPKGWEAYMWPSALGYFHELRDAQTVSQSDRHYLFYPLWSRPAETDFCHDERIKLDRAGSNLNGSQCFRIAEDLSNPKLRVTLQFKAVGMSEDDVLEIQLNSTKVPNKSVTRIFIEDGQNKWQGRELPAFYSYVIDLDRGMPNPFIINGDNQLTVSLIPTEGQNAGDVIIDELEVYVYVTP